MFNINIGKTGATVPVDETRFTPEVLAYVIRYGLTQCLNDAHSAVTAKSEPDDEKRHAEVAALVDKKLAALYAGDVRSNGGGRTSDPVAAEAKKIAEARLKNALKDKTKNPEGKTRKDFTDEAWRVAITTQAAAADVVAEAKANVARAAENAATVDLSALGL